ncbi:MAG: hypothetical protein M2R45_01663 [Verrucomicrobia subdivision 3 bacterium]|nr:hypothetical protein [Limisphaerales bacterium]MCS1412814.1 hypothetical protein [Limisphaerales bacterium]
MVAQSTETDDSAAHIALLIGIPKTPLPYAKILLILFLSKVLSVAPDYALGRTCFQMNPAIRYPLHVRRFFWFALVWESVKARRALSVTRGEAGSLRIASVVPGMELTRDRSLPIVDIQNGWNWICFIRRFFLESSDGEFWD